MRVPSVASDMKLLASTVVALILAAPHAAALPVPLPPESEPLWAELQEVGDILQPPARQVANALVAAILLAACTIDMDGPQGCPEEPPLGVELWPVVERAFLDAYCPVYTSRLMRALGSPEGGDCG